MTAHQDTIAQLARLAVLLADATGADHDALAAQARDLAAQLPPAAAPLAAHAEPVDTLAQAQARAARIRRQGTSEADYAAIRAYMYRHGFQAAVEVHGEEYVRAAWLPTD